VTWVHNTTAAVLWSSAAWSGTPATTPPPILSYLRYCSTSKNPHNLTTSQPSFFTSTSSISLFTTPGLYLTWLSNLFVGRGFHSLSPELGWNTHLFASPRCTKFIPHARALKNFLGSVGIYSVTIPHSFTGAFLLSRHHESKQRYV